MILVVLKAKLRAKYVDEFPTFIAEFADGKHTFKGVRPRPVDNPLPSGRPA